MTDRTTRREAGFTLLEMLIALAIIAILAGIASVQLPKRISILRAEQAADTIEDMLQSSRLAALASGDQTSVEFDIQGNVAILNPVGQIVPFPDQMEISLIVDAENVSAANTAEIAFFPDGYSTGGQITIRLPARSFHVTVDWLTGSVSRERLVE